LVVLAAGGYSSPSSAAPSTHPPSAQPSAPVGPSSPSSPPSTAPTVGPTGTNSSQCCNPDGKCVTCNSTQGCCTVDWCEGGGTGLDCLSPPRCYDPKTETCCHAPVVRQNSLCPLNAKDQWTGWSNDTRHGCCLGGARADQYSFCCKPGTSCCPGNGYVDLGSCCEEGEQCCHDSTCSDGGPAGPEGCAYSWCCPSTHTCGKNCRKTDRTQYPTWDCQKPCIPK